MKYILNKTYGINGIENIDFEKIVGVFGFPEERILKVSCSGCISINVSLVYNEFNDNSLEISYSLDFFVEKPEVPETQYLSFILKKFYLNEK